MKPVHIKIGLVALLALPAVNLLWQVSQALQGQLHDLGPDPGKQIVVELGQWALWLLLVVFAASPVRLWFGWRWLVVHRRLIGLAVFFYFALHMTAYIVFLLEFHFSEIIEDDLERPYMTMGMMAAILLTPLAGTSNDFSVRHLGSNWKRLHRLIYPAMGFVIIHITWIARSDLLEPLLYLLFVLLCFVGRSRRLVRLFKAD